VGGKGCESVTVQVLALFGARTPGLQATADIVTGVSSPMVAVCEIDPRVAVTIAFWLLGRTAAAVALNVATVDPEAIVTEMGTVRRALLLPSVTLAPPAGAA
jgi:hypothetical protein